MYCRFIFVMRSGFIHVCGTSGTTTQSDNNKHVERRMAFQYKRIDGGVRTHFRLKEYFVSIFVGLNLVYFKNQIWINKFGNK